jgi:hypothetical protein
VTGGKFVLDTKVIGDIAKHDPALSAAVDAAARSVLKDAGPNARIHTYTTDRHVAGITVPAIDQAKHGRLTKAVGINAGSVDHGGDRG